MDAKLFLKSCRASYPNNIIVGHLNIKSLRNNSRFYQADTFDMFMLYETKLGDSFTSAQFLLKGFSVPHRLDRNEKGVGVLLYVREMLIVPPL